MFLTSPFLCRNLSYFVDKSIFRVILKSKDVKILKKRLLCLFAAVCLALSGCGTKQEEKANTIAQELEKAKILSSGYFYDEALALLDGSQYKDDEQYVDLKNEINTKKGQLVKYDGQFYHVFFHSLIVYPELAFDGDYMHEGYDMWMTTVSEFKNMLPQLYERGFILYSMADIQSDKEVILPPGKKPLVISIDDVCYYDYMKNDGFADRLVINEAGEVACEVRTPEGEKIVTYDGDVMPILDQFVKEHPDFSYRGAKGVVALTGYEGALGYRITDHEGAELAKAQEEVKKIATIMKENGWLFACHSYTHNDYFKDGGVAYDTLVNDTQRWEDTIAQYVLDPDIYISPFGYHLKEGDERLGYLSVDMGYKYFCPVSTAMRTIFTEGGTVIQERFNLDRFNMRNQKDFINETFFDVDSVYYNIPE